jgi:hypothetical protein
VFAPNYNGVNHLYLNNGNSNNWLVIQCDGRVSNRSAIGAKVRVKATIAGKTMWQLREISGGGNYFAQNDPRARFGLGDATNADVVRIEWPSGIVQELTNVTAKQFLTVIERAKLQADYQPATGEFHLTVLGGKGLAYAIEQTTNLSSWIACAQLTNQTGAVIWTNLPDLQGVGIFYRAREL